MTFWHGVADPGGPKTHGSYGSGYTTLVSSVHTNTKLERRKNSRVVQREEYSRIQYFGLTIADLKFSNITAPPSTCAPKSNS